MGKCQSAVAKLKYQKVDDKSEVGHFYKLKGSIGSGSYGVVRKAARRTNPNMKVAVKSIDKQRLKQYLNAFRREIEILQSMDHPNIVKMYDFFENDRYFHIVTEYCSGGELTSRIDKIDEREASRYLQMILKAVHFLHSLGISHRDIKPENFLFERPGPDAQLKMIDFGLANRVQGSYSRMESMVGTVHYMAPEVSNGSYQPKCDLWSVGVMMYEMVYGILPFIGKTDSDILQNVQKGHLKFPNKRISLYGKDLLRKLLKTDPSLRISAQEALEHPWIKQQMSEKEIDTSILETMTHFKSSSQMRDIAMGLIVKFLSAEQVKDLREVFDSLDTDKNGWLSLEEIENGLKRQGLELTNDQINQLFKDIDVLGNGSINYSEFLAATVKLNEDMLRNAFEIFDSDGSGDISKQDIAYFLEKSGKNASAEQIEQIFSEVKTKDGYITFEEFKRVFNFM